MIDKQTVSNLWEKFISIQSVSTDMSRNTEIFKTVDFLSSYLKKLNFQIKVLKRNSSPPLIIAQKNLTGAKKTIGIYGHYDIQPEDPVNEWLSPPFKLTLRNGKYYGRGTADNKGHVVENLASINQLIDTKRLKNNIVFIFEGEEETGSAHFEECVKQAREVLEKIDVFYLTDVGMANKNQPQIFYGLRGIIYFELKLQIGEKDLHSGVYGNRVLNPAQILANLLVQMKGAGSNKINIPHFYDRCQKASPDEIERLKETIKTIDHLQKNAQVYKIVEYDGIHPGLSSKLYPSFEVNGLLSGFIGEGQKTIIPREAMVKFSFRLVEYQDPDEIEKLVRDFVKKNIPDGVKYELKTLSKSSPFYTDIDNQYLKTTKKVLEKVFGNKCLLNRSGGSVPAAEVLQRLFKKPTILTGFTLPDDNIHAPNENFDKEMFWKGIVALEKIYSQ